MAPSTSERCLERAAACERLALATNEDTREIMLYLANRWRDLAEEVAVEQKTDVARALPASPSE